MRNNKRVPFVFENTGRIGCIDLLLCAVGFALTAVIVTGTWQFTAVLSPSEKAAALLSCAFAIFFFRCFDMYAVMLLKPRPTVVTAVLSAIYTFFCTFLILFLFTRRTDYLGFLALGNLLSFFLLCLWRLALYRYHKNRPCRKKMLMVEKRRDDSSRVRRVKYASMSHFDTWYEQVDVENREEVQAFIEKFYPDYDAICLLETIPLEIRSMLLEAGLRMNKECYIVPVMYEMNFARAKPAYLDDVMVFRLSPARISWVALALKRLMDLVFACAGLAVAWLPMCIIALAVKLTSPGPVFYKQLRLTKDKKEFYIYKFRSMVQNAEENTGPALASRGDPRITAVGKWLRKSHLDELPQLINILKGDMSVVGPRPERPFFVAQYEKEIPDYDKRFAMKAGLTALSHVYGRYSTDIVDRTHYDLLYVHNYSLVMDLWIMLLTSRTLFLSDSAEGIGTADRVEAADESK